MAFCLKRILLLHVLAVTLHSLTGGPVKRLRSNRADTVNKARDESSQANFLNRPEETKRNPGSTFKFLNDSELAKGFDYLNKTYPDVDWSFVLPLPTSSNADKRELQHGNSLRHSVKRTFDFLNQSEIAKGFDYLKKKYPDVDWSFVLPLPTSSNADKRELQHGNSLRHSVKRTFDFVNESEIAKGFDYLKKKYPDVDWSFVIPLPTSSNADKRELQHGNSLRHSVKRTFDFVNESEIAKGFDYLKKTYPDVDWSFVMPLPTSSPGRRELKGQIMESKTNSITNKRLLVDQQKKGFFDSFNQQRNTIPGRRQNSEGSSNEKERNDITSRFEFLDPQKEMEGLEYLLEKHP